MSTINFYYLVCDSKLRCFFKKKRLENNTKDDFYSLKLFQHLVLWSLNLKHLVAYTDSAFATSCAQQRLQSLDDANYGRNEGFCWP